MLSNVLFQRVTQVKWATTVKNRHELDYYAKYTFWPWLLRRLKTKYRHLYLDLNFNGESLRYYLKTLCKTGSQKLMYLLMYLLTNVSGSRISHSKVSEPDPLEMLKGKLNYTENILKWLTTNKPSLQAHTVKSTFFKHRCGVVKLHRRGFNVVGYLRPISWTNLVSDPFRYHIPWSGDWERCFFIPRPLTAVSSRFDIIEVISFIKRFSPFEKFVTETFKCMKSP